MAGAERDRRTLRSQRGPRCGTNVFRHARVRLSAAISSSPCRGRARHVGGTGSGEIGKSSIDGCCGAPRAPADHALVVSAVGHLLMPRFHRLVRMAGEPWPSSPLDPRRRSASVRRCVAASSTGVGPIGPQWSSDGRRRGSLHHPPPLRTGTAPIELSGHPPAVSDSSTTPCTSPPFVVTSASPHSGGAPGRRAVLALGRPRRRAAPGVAAHRLPARYAPTARRRRQRARAPTHLEDES